jgi:hypothetical protein
VKRAASTLLWLGILSLIPGLANSTATQTPGSGKTTSALKDVAIADTYFVDCAPTSRGRRLVSTMSRSGDWRAYVEVRVDANCLHTTKLWAAKAHDAYRLIHLMTPNRSSIGNGMKILGWAPGSRMVLVQTIRWQEGSDAGPSEGVLAIDAKNGLTYEPDLSAVKQDRPERCGFNVTGARFAPGPNVVILVNVKLFTAMDADETESDIPIPERCTATEQTWSFNYATGEVRRLADGSEFVGTTTPARKAISQR